MPSLPDAIIFCNSTIGIVPEGSSVIEGNTDVDNDGSNVAIILTLSPPLNIGEVTFETSPLPRTI